MAERHGIYGPNPGDEPSKWDVAASARFPFDPDLIDHRENLPHPGDPPEPASNSAPLPGYPLETLGRNPAVLDLRRVWPTGQKIEMVGYALIKVAAVGSVTAIVIYVFAVLLLRWAGLV